MLKLGPSKKMFLGVIDHTFLKTEQEGVSFETQLKEVEKIVVEAVQHNVFAVCVRERLVSHARKLIDQNRASVKIVSVVGFPKGDEFSSEEKIDLLKKAKDDGADEFDMVIPYQALKQGDEKVVYDDVLKMSRAAGNQVLKVIFENCYLSLEEKKKAYALAVKAFEESSFPLARRFLKTSTGFAKVGHGPIGATLEDMKLMYQYSQKKLGLKPAGGVKDYDSALQFFAAAGSPWQIEGEMINPYLFRIGTSSLVGELIGKEQQEKDRY